MTETEHLGSHQRGPVDTIRISGIRGFGYHGVLEHERRDGQEFIVDLVIDTPQAVQLTDSDDLSTTLDYRGVIETTHAAITGEPLQLIETLAERIAAGILQAGAGTVTVTVHKPHAPLAVSVSDVAVQITRSRYRAVIALGANLGDAAQTLCEAAGAIAEIPRVRVLAASSIYRTAPVGAVEQPDYCNAVMLVQADWDPPMLLRQLHRIEANFGRARTQRFGPRTLDLDLIDVRGPDGPVVWDAHSCQLPHPRAAQRRFVLEPWLEIEPDGWLGWTGSIPALLGALGDTQAIERTSEALFAERGN